MSRPIYEPNIQRTAARLNFGQEQLFRRPGFQPEAVLFIKVFSDTQTVTTGDGKFIFEVSEDMDNGVLSRVEMYVTTTSGSGNPTAQIRNVTAAVDMLSTKVQVDAGDLNSKDSGTQPVINTANDDVTWGDHIAIDIDIAGSGAKGLGVMLTFQV